MTNLQLSGHSSEVLAASFNVATTLLASAGVDKTIMIWSCKDSFTNSLNLKSHTNAVTALTWSHTDRLVTGSADKSVCSWDVEVGRVVRKYRGHTAVVQDVACPKKTRELIGSVGDDGSLRVWEQRSKEELKVYQTKYPITSVSFSLNGEKLYTGGIDNDIHVYKLGEDKQEDTIEGHQDTISSLSISHDGSYLLSNSFDETLRVWDIRPGVARGRRLAKTMSGHSQGTDKTLIRGCWSRDGLYVACGSTDKCVYVWDTATRNIVQRLGGHVGTVTQVDFGKDNLLVSASNDKTLIVSQLPDIFL
jgi:Prp8 binding protein